MNQRYQQIIYRAHRMGRKVFIHNNLIDNVYLNQNPFTRKREYMYDSDIMAVIEAPLEDIDIDDVAVYELVNLEQYL